MEGNDHDRPRNLSLRRWERLSQNPALKRIEGVQVRCFLYPSAIGRTTLGGKVSGKKSGKKRKQKSKVFALATTLSKRASWKS